MTNWFDTSLSEGASREEFLRAVEDLKSKHTLNDVERGVLDLMIIHDEVSRRSEKVIKSGSPKESENFDLPIPMDSIAMFVKIIKEREIPALRGMPTMDVHAIGMMAGVVLGMKLAESKLK